MRHIWQALPGGMVAARTTEAAACSRAVEEKFRPRRRGIERHTAVTRRLRTSTEVKSAPGGGQKSKSIYVLGGGRPPAITSAFRQAGGSPPDKPPKRSRIVLIPVFGIA